jgi:hypothetical protein
MRNNKDKTSEEEFDDSYSKYTYNTSFNWLNK